MHSRAHGVVVSHPLRMRKALGSNPSVSTFHSRRSAYLRNLCSMSGLPHMSCSGTIKSISCLWPELNSRHAHCAATATAGTHAGTAAQKIGAWFVDRALVFTCGKPGFESVWLPRFLLESLLAPCSRKLPHGLEVGQPLHMQESWVRISVASLV